MKTETFLAAMKIKAQKKAGEMARLELSIWDESHEQGLKEYGLSESEIRRHKKSQIKNFNIYLTTIIWKTFQCVCNIVKQFVYQIYKLCKHG